MRESCQPTPNERIAAHEREAADCYRLSEQLKQQGDKRRADYWQKVWLQKVQDVLDAKNPKRSKKK